MLHDPMYAALACMVLLIGFVSVFTLIGNGLMRRIDARRRFQMPVIVVYNLVMVNPSSTSRFPRPLKPHKDAIRALEHRLRYMGRTQGRPSRKDLN